MIDFQKCNFVLEIRFIKLCHVYARTCNETINKNDFYLKINQRNENFLLLFFDYYINAILDNILIITALK